MVQHNHISEPRNSTQSVNFQAIGYKKQFLYLPMCKRAMIEMKNEMNMIEGVKG